MLIASDSLTRFGVIVALFLPAQIALADDISTWTKAFQLFGTAAGQYSACTHRDLLPDFAKLARFIAIGPLHTKGENLDSPSDIATALVLDDVARTSYFIAQSAPCDPTRLAAIRADVQKWQDTIHKAASSG